MTPLYRVQFYDWAGWPGEIEVKATSAQAAIRHAKRIRSGIKRVTAYRLGPRRRSNPVKSSDHTLKTLGYTLLVAGLTAGVGAVVIYYVNKKLEPPPKEDALDIKIGGTAADQAKAAADKAAADAKAWADWAARGGTWGATPETGKA